MERLNLTQKKRCMGCAALTEGNQPAYSCSLGFPIQWESIDGQSVKPIPKSPCYRPKTKSELKKAKDILRKKAAK